MYRSKRAQRRLTRDLSDLSVVASVVAAVEPKCLGEIERQAHKRRDGRPGGALRAVRLV